jgi:hypothetical protein
VGSELIVVMSPDLDEASGLLEAPEPTFVEAFIFEPAVEAFAGAVLLGYSGLDEVVPDLSLVTPLTEGPAGEFWPVVGDDDFWPTALVDDQIQHDCGLSFGRPSLDIPIGEGWGLGHGWVPGREPDASRADPPGCSAPVALRAPFAAHPGGWGSSFRLLIPCPISEGDGIGTPLAAFGCAFSRRTPPPCRSGRSICGSPGIPPSEGAGTAARIRTVSVPQPTPANADAAPATPSVGSDIGNWIDPSEPRDRPGVRSNRGPSAGTGRPSCDLRASEFFCEQVPQPLVVERQLAHELLQLPVLLLQSLQPFGIGYFHPAVLRLPSVEGLFAHAQLSAQLGKWATSLMLFQGEDDLLLGVSALSQGVLLSGELS